MKNIIWFLRTIEISDEVWLFGISEGTLKESNHAFKVWRTIKTQLQYDPEWKEFYNKLGKGTKFLNKIISPSP